MSAIDLNITSGSTKNQLGDGGQDSPQVEAKLSEISKRLSQLQEENERSYLEQGQLLREAKSLFCKHGEWLDWLKENFPFSTRQAQRLMRVAEWFTNTTPVSHLDFSKAYILTKISPNRVNDFLKQYETADVDVKPLSRIQNMSKIDLEKAIREFLLCQDAAQRTGKKKKTETNSSVQSSEDNALAALCLLETTMANLMGNLKSQPCDDETYDTLVSEIHRLCENTLGKLPSEDVEIE